MNTRTRGARTEMSNAEHSTQDLSIPALFALNPQEHSTALQPWKAQAHSAHCSLSKLTLLPLAMPPLGILTSRILKSPDVHLGGFKPEDQIQVSNLLITAGSHRSLHPFPVSNLDVSGIPSPPGHYQTAQRGGPGANKHMYKCSF